MTRPDLKNTEDHSRFLKIEHEQESLSDQQIFILMADSEIPEGARGSVENLLDEACNKGDKLLRGIVRIHSNNGMPTQDMIQTYMGQSDHLSVPDIDIAAESESDRLNMEAKIEQILKSGGWLLQLTFREDGLEKFVRTHLQNQGKLKRSYSFLTGHQ